MTSKAMQSARGTGSNMWTNHANQGGNSKAGSASTLGRSIFITRAIYRNVICCKANLK
jgi:hypothetical protein